MNKKTFSPSQKASVALAALRGDKTMSEISSLYQVHETQIRHWKKIAETNFMTLFSDTHAKVQQEQLKMIDELYRMIGQKDIELDWLKKKLHVVES